MFQERQPVRSVYRYVGLDSLGRSVNTPKLYRWDRCSDYRSNKPENFPETGGPGTDPVQPRQHPTRIPWDCIQDIRQLVDYTGVRTGFSLACNIS